jgi:hypothetical protein
MAGASIIESLLRGDAPLGPDALTFLMRRYAATGDAQLRPALERGLTQALDQVVDGDSPAAWIHVLCEAAAITDDERIADAVAGASRALRDQWPCRGSLRDAMRSVDACLAAASLVGSDLVAASIDELERIVGLVYRPGERLPRTLQNPDGDDGGVEEHVAAATALLTAHDVTARLPYSMLAEELIQPVRAMGAPKGPHYVLVLCRLARLHDDEEYARAAVVARESDYRAEARAILENVGRNVDANREDAALFGIVTDELARTS